MSAQKTLLFVAFTALLLATVSLWQDQLQQLPSNYLDDVVSNSNCGGNCPGNNCDNCWCGSSKNVISAAAIANVCAGYSWNQACCKCIVSKESGGNLNAVGQNSGVSASYKYDVGLFQVNSFNWNACNGGAAPCSQAANFACAKKVYGWGGWKNWSTGAGCGCA